MQAEFPKPREDQIKVNLSDAMVTIKGVLNVTLPESAAAIQNVCKIDVKAT